MVDEKMSASWREMVSRLHDAREQAIRSGVGDWLELIQVVLEMEETFGPLATATTASILWPRDEE